MSEKPKWTDLWGSNPELKAEDVSCCRKLDKYEDAIKRVRELHIPCSDESADLFDYQYCLGCSTPDQETPMPYPCPTIRTLDGEQE